MVYLPILGIELWTSLGAIFQTTTEHFKLTFQIQLLTLGCVICIPSQLGMGRVPFLYHCEYFLLKLSSETKKMRVVLLPVQKTWKSFPWCKIKCKFMLSKPFIESFSHMVPTHFVLLFPFKPLTHPMVHFLPHKSFLKLFTPSASSSDTWSTTNSFYKNYFISHPTSIKGFQTVSLIMTAPNLTNAKDVSYRDISYAGCHLFPNSINMTLFPLFPGKETYSQRS